MHYQSHRISRGVLVAIAVLLSCVGARTQTPAAGAALREEFCPVAPGYRSVKLRAKLPPVLQKRFRDVAMPEEPWNSTDTISDDEPFSGLYFAWNRGNRWIVMIGQGGSIAVPPPVIDVFDVSPDGGAILAHRRPNTSGISCEAAMDYAKS